MKKKKENRIISILLIFLLISSILTLGFLISKEMKKELSIYHMENDLLENYVKKLPLENNIGNPDSENQTDSVSDIQIDWDALLKEGKDVVGWIYFEEPSRINYPIVQGDSNQTYLKHDWKGNYQAAGAIFLHKGNNPNFTDANSVIYGHRMIRGSMFGSLKEFKDQSFFDAHPYFYIYTPDGKKRIYEIFAYAKVQDGSDTYSLRFQTVGERLAYYEDVISKAITKRAIELDELDTTVTLSTCAGQGYYDRMVLMGKLIKIEVPK